MTTFSLTISKTFSSSELHEFLAKSLQLFDLKLPRSVPKIQSQEKSWDEWLAYFEAKDLNPDGLIEFCIFHILSVLIQQGQLKTISDPSFSWAELDPIARRNYLNIASVLHERSKFTKTLSFGQRFALPFFYLFLSVISGTNFISLDAYEREISDQYIKTVLRLSANFESINNDLQDSTAEDYSEIIHTFNSSGEPFSYNIKNLFWNPRAYDYLKEQEKLFEECLPELVQNFAGRYIVFENGLVIDSDEDENNLLNRIVNTEFYKHRPDAILFTFVPRSLLVNA